MQSPIIWIRSFKLSTILIIESYWKEMIRGDTIEGTQKILGIKNRALSLSPSLHVLNNQKINLIIRTKSTFKHFLKFSISLNSAHVRNIT